MNTAYAREFAEDTPLMRKQVHRLCVEISQDLHSKVVIKEEGPQGFPTETSSLPVEMATLTAVSRCSEMQLVWAQIFATCASF